MLKEGDLIFGSTPTSFDKRVYLDSETKESKAVIKKTLK